MNDPITIGAVFSVLLGLVGYLLRRQSDKQQKTLDELVSENVKRKLEIADMKTQLAREHYQKSELDMRFAGLKQSFTEGLDKVSGEVRTVVDAIHELTATMRTHIAVDAAERDILGGRRATDRKG